MNTIQSKLLKQRARQLLQSHSQDYRRLVVLHGAVSFGVLIVLMLVDMLLSQAISQTGGLSQIGTRSFLETVSSGLYTAANLLLPFWELGLLFTAIRAVRGQDFEFSMLATGFRRFGPVLRYFLLQLVIAVVTLIVCSHALVFIAFFVPIPQALDSFFMAADPAVISDPVALMEQLPLDAMLQYMLPVMVLFFLLYFGVTVHLQYRFRLAGYLLMEEQSCGAVAALTQSNQLTRGHKWQLFKLELSFWWYYVLQFLLALVAELPLVLPILGIYIPFSRVLFYLVYAAGSLGLLWIAGAYIQTTYACAYEQLSNPEQGQPDPEQ